MRESTTAAAPDRPDLPAIWVVSAYELADLALDLAPALNDRAMIHVIRNHFDGGVDEVRRIAADQRCEVVVSAGSNAEYLRARLDVPVVAVRVGGFDVMAALSAASVGVDRIALLFFREVPAETARFLYDYRIPVELHAYQSEADAHDLVARLAASGLRALVGPGVAARAARAQGISGVFLYSRASVAAALDEALSLVLQRRAERAGQERLASVLRHLDIGVIATDATGAIVAANPAADMLTGMALGTATGQQLTQLVPGLDAGDVLTSGDASTSPRVRDLMGHRVLVQAMPLMKDGRPEGAVFTLDRSSHVEQAFRKLRAHERPRSRPARYTLAHIVQASPQMRAVVRRCETVAAHSEAAVLITGPTGVGKELIAQGIHNASRRRGQRFVAINCGALAASLLESELFGYEDGAFTGARREGRVGLLEAAHRGTVLLDEIGELPMELQIRLLRVLQEGEITRVGGHEPVSVDIRVLAATHRDLQEMVCHGLFREDLYYRIAVLRIDVPPLASRPQDLEALAAIMVTSALHETSQEKEAEAVLRLLPDVLRNHNWPGNARELHNFAQRLALRCMELGAVPTPAEMVALIDQYDQRYAVDRGTAKVPTLPRQRAEDELRHIREVLAECDGSMARAATVLGVSRTTLWRRLRAKQG